MRLEQFENESKNKVTPLHIAYRLKNNRAVNLMLETLAKIESNNSSTFKDILSDLVEFQSFGNYI